MAVSAFGYWWDEPSGDESQMWRSPGGSEPSLYQGPPSAYLNSGVQTMSPTDNFTASYGGFSFDANTSDLMALMGGSPNSGYTDLKSALSDLANQTEAALRSNLNGYQSGAIDAATASATGWQLLNNMVSRMLSAGDIGLRSAAERDRRISNGAGLRWDWIAFYLDPIPGSTQSTGAAVVPSASTGLPTGATGQVYTSGFQTTDKNTLILFAGLALVVLVMRLKK